GISHAVKRHNYLINVIGSVNVINAALTTQVGFFGFASSVAVYGDSPPPMREDSHPVPVDSYGNAKLAVERELAITMRLQGMPFFALRMHNVYGEWQSMRDPYRNAVAIFMNQVMRDEPITIYGDGGQTRAFTYVGDIVGTFIAAGDEPEAWGHALNVGTLETTSVLGLATLVREAMEVPNHPIVHLPARREVYRVYTDTSLARRVLGDWPQTPLHKGLARAALWARNQGPSDLISNLRLEVADAQPAAWVDWIGRRLGEPKAVREIPADPFCR
ncbi:MAG: UDP-glucose 4-epimerase, partial [Mycobacterium sp.]|nr:UDP-glucose 4-epimerase [Mycobacterium sp.]